MLVDTSVWIDFFANRPTPQVNYLVESIKNQDNLYICGVILTEILQGIKHPKEHSQVASLLSCLVFLDMSRDTFVLSAKVYRDLRTKGVTIRKTIDCMIAAVSIENHVPLLHDDRDFNQIAKHAGLKTIHIH